KRDTDGPAGGVIHVGRRVGGHQGEAGGRYELGVHDEVLGARVRLSLTELGKGAPRQLAAEDRFIELHGLAGRVAEVEVGVEGLAGHNVSFGSNGRSSVKLWRAINRLRGRS